MYTCINACVFNSREFDVKNLCNSYKVESMDLQIAGYYLYVYHVI